VSAVLPLDLRPAWETWCQHGGRKPSARSLKRLATAKHSASRELVPIGSPGETCMIG
jgi:hypothetical protein